MITQPLSEKKKCKSMLLTRKRKKIIISTNQKTEIFI